MSKITPEKERERIRKMRKGKDINCKWCGKIFYVFPSRIKVTKFCSYICMRKYWKKHKIGVYNQSVQSKAGKIGAEVNRKNGTNCYFNLKLHSEIGKISGVIGGKRCHELHPNLCSKNGKNIHKKYPNLASEMGKKNIKKVLKTQQKEKKGFWNSNFQKEMGKRGGKVQGPKTAKILREKKRIKFNGIYFDSYKECEMGMCIHFQIEKIKEGKNYQIKIDSLTFDFFVQNCFIEYHPYNSLYDNLESYKNWGIKRRKVLNENGYNDYPLRVIK